MKIDFALISIIVPVYNASAYLQNCIDSILAQTYCNFELILVDDGSKDNSLEICESYKIKDSRIIVIHQENAGVSAARNAGLSLAKGNYFCFVDSDDSIEQDMIEKLYASIVKSNADISICGFKSISSKGVTIMKPVAEEIVGTSNIVDFIAEHYIEWLVSSPWGKLYRNIQFSPREFDRDISLGEDLKFNLLYFEKIEKIIIIEDSLYRYIDTDGSLTKTYKNGNYEAICNIYQTTIQCFNRMNRNISSINMKNINYKLFSFCISFMSQNMLNANSNRDARQFIARICDNELLQKAIKDLPDISFIKKLYVWGIKHKYVMWLWVLSLIKMMVRKHIQ